VDELFDSREARDEFDAAIRQVLVEATLAVPDVSSAARVAGKAGRDGVHSEAMGYLLAEMQSVARAHPGATW
jgi:ring-1,2-phenylacetyl-CoA epoxidase subunit PaaC